MVARKQGAEMPPKGVAQGLFLRWQALLGGWLHSASRAGVELTAASRGSAGALRGTAVAWVGMSCVIVGAAGRFALAASGSQRSAALIAGIAALMWAVARFAIVMATVRDLSSDTPAVRGAWAVGLTPMALALSPTLAAVAWMASGVLTAAVLVRLGESRNSASRSVAYAWGAQAAVSAVGWLVRNAVVALVAAGG